MRAKLITISISIILLTIFGFKQKKTNLEKLNLVTYKVAVYKNETKIKDAEVDALFDKLQLLEFELFYDSNSSSFSPLEKMTDDKDDFDLKIVKIMTNGIYYKNINTKEKIDHMNYLDQDFNVIKDFDEYKWTITTESKMINGYKCYKATTEKSEYNSRLNVTRTFNPVVWFAPEIPAPYGPKGLDGLPGLVLEGTYNGNMYFYATKIEFDYKTKSEVKISKPVKGKYITEMEFAKVLEESVEDQK